MTIYQESFALSTEGFCDVHDITDGVTKAVARSRVKDGLVSVSSPGSTVGLTTIEFEPGAVEDLKEALEKLVPMKKTYHHDARWGDGNGFAHVRSALVGAARVFPVQDGRIMLGTWQQVVFLDFDNRPRRREVLVQVLGE